MWTIFKLFFEFVTILLLFYTLVCFFCCCCFFSCKASVILAPWSRSEPATPTLEGSLNPLDRLGSRSLLHSHSNSGGGNGNPLQYSCLESPMDGGAWWATVQGGHKESDTTERSSVLTSGAQICRVSPNITGFKVQHKPLSKKKKIPTIMRCGQM